MVIGADGSLHDSAVYRARVRNHAKLAYNSVAAWLDGKGPMPAEIAAAKGVEAALRLQDSAARSMKSFRHQHGALSLETIEAKPIFDGDAIRDLQVEERNRAKDLIEDFMIAANGVTARFLASKKFPRSGGSCERPSGGTGSWRSPRSASSRCPVPLTRRPWRLSWKSPGPPIHFDSPTFPSR